MVVGQGAVHLFDVRSGAIAAKAQAPGGNCVAVTPDGRRFAVGGQGPNETGRITVWDAKSGIELEAWSAHESPVVALKFAPNGKILASISGDADHGRDRSLRFWETNPVRPVLQYQGLEGQPLGVGFFPDGRRFAAFGKNGQWQIGTRDGNVVEILQESMTRGDLSPTGAYFAWSGPACKVARYAENHGFVRQAISDLHQPIPLFVAQGGHWYLDHDSVIWHAAEGVTGLGMARSLR